MNKLATSYPQLGNTEGWFHVPAWLPFSMYTVEDPSKGIVEYSVGDLPTSINKIKSISCRNVQRHIFLVILDSIKLTAVTKVQQNQSPMSLWEVHLRLWQEMSAEEFEDNDHFVSGHVLAEESQ